MQEKVPLDVQVIVIEWVYRSSQHRAIDYPTLCACALVCRSWTPIAQRLFLRRVPVPDPYIEVQRFPQIIIDFILRTLRAAPSLAAHIRSVICNLAVAFDSDAEDDDVTVLALCTNTDSILFKRPLSHALVSRLPPTVLAHLVVLESFVMINLPTEQDFALPRSLRHLGYHPSVSTPKRERDVQILLDAIRARPGLQLITTTDNTLPWVWNLFKSVCREVGAEFVLYLEPACISVSGKSGAHSIWD
ncbi:hypothetical protein FA95DRAFT_1680452 [Auriscalpium vulgare]|uniref:Uncharacterized protein n=1 Tax=Auriscalpium vulgare TaxID=40419 RepID=A0ACB8RN97_9AGAM|nr:hypothetical protein FA95DRAFT_1680452 [Auriscalpium vulgare]